jgi:hypothetical protein
VTIPPKPTRRTGRPTALEAAEHKIAMLERELARERERARAAAGERLSARAVLEEIAKDPSTSAMARVSAVRTLLKMDAEATEDDELDPLTRRALEMGGGRHD